MVATTAALIMPLKPWLQGYAESLGLGTSKHAAVMAIA